MDPPIHTGTSVVCARFSPRGICAHDDDSQTFIVTDKDRNPLLEVPGPESIRCQRYQTYHPWSPRTASDVSGQAEVTHTEHTRDSRGAQSSSDGSGDLELASGHCSLRRVVFWDVDPDEGLLDVEAGGGVANVGHNQEAETLMHEFWRNETQVGFIPPSDGCLYLLQSRYFFIRTSLHSTYSMSWCIHERGLR